MLGYGAEESELVLVEETLGSVGDLNCWWEPVEWVRGGLVAKALGCRERVLRESDGGGILRSTSMAAIAVVLRHPSMIRRALDCSRCSFLGSGMLTLSQTAMAYSMIGRIQVR